MFLFVSFCFSFPLCACGGDVAAMGFFFFSAPAPSLSSFLKFQLLYFSSSSEVSSSSGFSLKNFGRRYEFLQNGVAANFVYYLPFPQEYIVYSPSQIYHILSKKCLTLFGVRAIIHTSTRESSRKEVKLWQLRRHFVTVSAPSIPKH